MRYGTIFISCEWLIAAINIISPIILLRAVVTATSQGSFALPVFIAVPFPFLAENLIVAAEGTIIAEACCSLSAGIQISIAHEI